jgi:hypothetical protein
VGRQHHRDRVAREQHEREGDDAHQEEHHHRLAEPLNEETEHQVPILAS